MEALVTASQRSKGLRRLFYSGGALTTTGWVDRQRIRTARVEGQGSTSSSVRPQVSTIRRTIYGELTRVTGAPRLGCSRCRT